ncbi:hypothetical protein PSP6_800007 [Paraburkholderia tropica]|uniref:hypothetical protein n=1 Tax=Paraburkholderia tropica TaxID=92647 RepID=UPI001CB450E5|nr:hypothetical protein [Paraburkholderia tropica]CAG9239342.1 hypothetical protein PSP6_800007 [Paraburkholderia tropica]
MKFSQNREVSKNHGRYFHSAAALHKRYGIPLSMIELYGAECALPRRAGGEYDAAWLSYFIVGHAFLMENPAELTPPVTVFVGYMQALGDLVGEPGGLDPLKAIFLRNGLDQHDFTDALDEGMAFFETKLILDRLRYNRNPHV